MKNKGPISTDSGAVNQDDSHAPGFVEVAEAETQIDVLHVDDDRAFANTTAELLERQHDISVHPESQPEDTIEYLENNEIDCIVADYEMPGRNGLELLEAVRERHPNLPFILFTGKGPEEIAGEAIAKGATDYLQKGTSTAQYDLLANRIDNAVTQRRCALRSDKLEQQFVEHAEKTNNVLWTFGPDMEEVIFINSAFEELYGISIDRFRENPLSFLEATHPEDRLHVEEAVNRLRDGHPIDIKHRVNEEEEYERWVQVQAQPIYNSDDEVVRIVGLITEITEQKEREKQLRQFQQAIESSGHSFYFTDSEGNIEYVNPTFEETTGYTADELIGETPEMFQSSVYDEGSYEDMWETLRDGTVWRGELINERKDGEHIAVDQTIAPVTDEAGEITHFVAANSDITQRKKMERKRRQAIERMTDGVFELDADWHCTLISDHAETILGVSESELVGQNFWDVFENARGTTFETQYQKVMDTREPTSFVEYYDEFECWFDVEVYPNEDGGIAVYFQDITERKEREKYLELLDRVLRHNLRNDMNVIRGKAEIIHRESTNGVGEWAEVIINTSDKLIELAEKERKIVEVLQSEPNHREINMSLLLKKIVSQLKSEHPHVTFNLDCPDSITAHASEKFGMAFEELITNAVVHNESNSPDIGVTVRSNEDTVSIEIVDDGPPIPEMDQNALLQDNKRTSLYHGSGLGLSLVKVLTSRSNGSISFNKTSSTGNAIELKLPS